jgi:hypothetical protein
MTIRAASPGAPPVSGEVITTLAARAGMACLGGGVFFAAYLFWRPFEILLTFSDGLFLVAAVCLIVAGTLQLRPLGAFMPWWIIAFIVMVAGLLLGTIANGEPLRWSVAAAQYGFAMLVLPCLLVGHGPDRTVWLAKAMLAGVVAMELFGILVYFLSTGGYAEHQQFGKDFISGARRLGAFAGDANWNGAYAAMSLPFVIYLHARRQVPGWLATLAAAVLVEALLLAASVSAIASAIIGVIAMLAVGGQRLPKWPFALVALGVAAYFGSGQPLPQAFSTRIVPALDSGNLGKAGTFADRFDLMREAWAMAGDTTLVGIGFDQYRLASPHGAPVHNMYLLLWTEGGVLALFGWLAMLAILIATALVAMRRDRLTAALALSVITVFIVASTGSPHMYARLWMVPVAMSLAFVFDTMNRKDAR